MSHADLRARILEEAIGTVYREGVDGITIRSLAHKLGYAPATIYLYFTSKAELEFEIGFHGFELLWREMSPAFSREDPREALVELMGRYIDFGVSNPQLYRLMFQDMTRLQEGKFANDLRVARVRHGVISVYEKGLEQGSFRPCNPELETAVGWAVLHGFVQLTIHGVLPSQGLSSDPAPVREALIEQRVRALLS